MIDFYDVVDNHVRDFESQLFTSLPATVVSFDSDTQTIVAQVVMTEPQESGVNITYPEIPEVPLIFPSAGGGSLTFPVSKGDEVLLVFSSRNIASWWDTGITGQLPISQRYHDLTDAIALIGFTSKPNSVKASTEDVELKFKDNKITLKADGSIEMVSKSTLSVVNGSNELISVISEALQAMADITTNTVYGISPVNNKSDILSIKSKLDTFKK